MGKRRADATGRRFTDEFPSVRVSRFRANGTIDPAKRNRNHRVPRRLDQAHRRRPHASQVRRRLVLLHLPEAAPRSPRRSTPSTTSRSAGDAVTSSTSGIAANGAWAARSACEPPISNSTGSSPSSKPTSRCAQTGASELAGQSAARLPQPSPDPTHAPQHDHAQAQSARKPARPGRRAVGLNLTRAFTPRKDALAAIPELGQVWRASQPNAWSRRSTMLNPSCSRHWRAMTLTND